MSFKDNDGTTSGILPFYNYGLWGDSQTEAGVFGTSDTGAGVVGESNRIGVSGNSQSIGVYGNSNGTSSISVGVKGESSSLFEGQGSGTGVLGISGTGAGVIGESVNGPGIMGHGHNNKGVIGLSNSSSIYDDAGVYGSGASVSGVYGHSRTFLGVFGISDGGTGVGGLGNGVGVEGYSNNGHGVVGSAGKGAGVYARNETYPNNEAYLALPSLAGGFLGDVYVSGYLKKSGGGFEIDHPLDPAHKLLGHAFVESPDMKNIYDGVARLDDRGEALVDLPEWFESLNQDFRYQLTPMGAPAPNLFIAEEIIQNHFKIAGGQAGMKVSWQVTGSRRDAWAQANPVQVEQEKPVAEQGHYLHPHLFNQPEEKSIRQIRYPKSAGRLPAMNEQVREIHQKAEEMRERATQMREKFYDKSPFHGRPRE